jgi:ribosomal protein S18 acetylase RimI-like enzyme
MNLAPVQPTDLHDFRRIVEAYWREVMPQSDVIQQPERPAAYFAERFPWTGGTRQLYWAVVDGRRVGFVAYTVDTAQHAASIDDFYVVPKARRRGYGAAMGQAVYTQLDPLGVALVELHVRRDTPHALAFWEAQGLRIALYRMRQYRDPKTGTAYIGALSSDFA